MLSERHEKDAIKKALTEAQEKNEELLMKVEDANEKIEQLQTTINMCVPSLMLGRWFILLVQGEGGRCSNTISCTLPNDFTMFYTYSHIPSCVHACP